MLAARAHVSRLASPPRSPASTPTTSTTPSRPQRRHLGGPQLALAWVTASRPTRYTGPRRALCVGRDRRVLPARRVDVRRRHHRRRRLARRRRAAAVRAAATRCTRRARPRADRARRHRAAPARRRLRPRRRCSPAPLVDRRRRPASIRSRFPPNLRFIEPLRGYEDFAITDRPRRDRRRHVALPADHRPRRRGDAVVVPGDLPARARPRAVRRRRDRSRRRPTTPPPASRSRCSSQCPRPAAS